MIAHKNLLKVMQSFSPLAQVLSPKDIYIAYLPLAHLYELEFELFFLSLGMSIGYATPSTLTDNSTGIKKGYKGDSSLLRPTVMAAVPLILNRIRKNIEEQVEQRGYFFKILFNLAIDYKKLCTKNGFKTVIIISLSY
jgi:long-chain acyl-CoA synthetase